MCIGGRSVTFFVKPLYLSAADAGSSEYELCRLRAHRDLLHQGEERMNAADRDTIRALQNRVEDLRGFL